MVNPKKDVSAGSLSQDVATVLQPGLDLGWVHCMPKVLQNLWEITAAGAALLTNKLVCLQYVKYLLQMFHMLLQSLREHQNVIPAISWLSGCHAPWFASCNTSHWPPCFETATLVCLVRETHWPPWPEAATLVCLLMRSGNMALVA